MPPAHHLCDRSAREATLGGLHDRRVKIDVHPIYGDSVTWAAVKMQWLFCVMRVHPVARSRPMWISICGKEEAFAATRSTLHARAS